MARAGPHTRTSHPQPVGRDPGHTPQGQAVGVGRVPNPDSPHRGTRRPPTLGAVVPRLQRARPARKSVRCTGGDGSPRAQPLCPQLTGSGPQPPAPRTGGRGRKSVRPRACLREARGAPPWAPSCPLHRPQSQLAGACAVGLVTGPRATPFQAHRKRAACPSHLPQGPLVGGGTVPNPGRHSQRHQTPPAGALLPPSQTAEPARKSVRLGVRDASSRPHPPRRQKTGSGPRPHAPKTSNRGMVSA